MQSTTKCSHSAAEAATKHKGPVIPEVSVNGQAISEDEVARELQYHPAEDAQQAILQSVEALVVRSLLLQKAETLGIVARENEGETADEAVIRVLLEREVRIPEADEAACRQYYDANQEKFRTPPLMEVNHILLGVAPDDIEGRRSAREHAESLVQQLQKQPELFAEFAREFSDCPSKAHGGNLGQISKGQTVPEFENQLFLMSAGLANKPVESRYGFHVVQVANRIDGEVMPYDICRTRIAEYLQDHAWVKAVSQYIDMLMSEADIKGMDNPGSGTPLVQ
ncbi:MAG: peptidylprolyl isomerase [Ketobacteraceae bacterium]|nr:peptidylprolyl isomerase [Ketobacteraceae bacterium]